MVKKAILVLLISITWVIGDVMFPNLVFSQENIATDSLQLASSSADLASSAAQEKQAIEKLKKDDITQPEESWEKQEILALFSRRQIEKLDITNFMAFTVQFAVTQGVPANTVTLILLLPFLATLVAFVRHVVGLPSLEMLVPVTLSVTLIATGITAGFILLLTILAASFCSRFVLKRIRIMQLPKMALSILVVSGFVFMSLTLSAVGGILIVKQLSIFPILIFILLSDKIVAVQLERSLQETLLITLVTIGLGILGYLFLSSDETRIYIVLYPEIALLLIPINIMIGRYFGLRLTEFYRFSSIQINGNK